MKIRSFVCLAMAFALPATAAHAADLPVIVEPVDYVRVCDAAGTGFFVIPQTDTCMRIRTRVRTDYNLYFDFDDNDENFYSGDTDDRLYRFRARGYVRTNTVTETEFGQLITFTDIFVSKDSARRGGGGSSDASVTLDSAVIEFGGLLLGRFTSTFAIEQGIYVVKQEFDVGVNDDEYLQLAYQFDFGNGITAQLSLEDNTEHHAGIVGLPIGAFQPLDVRYGGAILPDVVGKLEIEQGWGSAAVSAAGHYVNTVGDYLSPAGVPLRVDDEAYGFAVAGGIAANLPFGSGTQVGIQAGYALGAQEYLMDDFGAFADAPDATIDRNGNLDLGEFFQVAGGFETSLTPSVAAAVAVGYMYGGYDAIEDVRNVNVQANLGWTPTRGLLFLLGGEYRYIDNGADGEGSLLTTFVRAQADF